MASSVILQQGISVDLSRAPVLPPSNDPALLIPSFDGLSALLSISSQATTIQQINGANVFSLALDSSGAFPVVALAAGSETVSSGVTIGGIQQGVLISADNNKSGIVVAPDETVISSYTTISFNQAGGSTLINIIGGSIPGAPITGNTIEIGNTTGKTNISGNTNFLTSVGSTGANDKDTVDFTDVDVIITPLVSFNITEFNDQELPNLPTDTAPSDPITITTLDTNGAATILVDGLHGDGTVGTASAVFMVIKRRGIGAVIFQAPSIAGATGELWGLNWLATGELQIFLNQLPTGEVLTGPYAANVTVIHNPSTTSTVPW